MVLAPRSEWREPDPAALQDRLRDLIEARKKAKPAPKKGKEAPAPKAGNVISLMEALKKSVQDKPAGGKGAPKGGKGKR